MSETPRPIKFKLRFEAEEGEEVSRIRPAYANNFSIQRFESDIFFDVCIMPLDALAQIKPEEREPEVEMVVLDRYVLSVSTLLRLRDSVNKMYAQLSEQGMISDDAAERTQTKIR